MLVKMKIKKILKKFKKIKMNKYYFTMEILQKMKII